MLLFFFELKTFLFLTVNIIKTDFTTVFKDVGYLNTWPKNKHISQKDAHLVFSKMLFLKPSTNFRSKHKMKTMDLLHTLSQNYYLYRLHTAGLYLVHF